MSSNEEKVSANPNNISHAPVLRRSSRKKINTEKKEGYPQLFIKTLTGKIITIDYNKSDTILQVKTKIKAQNSVPEDDMRLVVAGGRLEDDKTLEDYHIQKGSTIYLLLRLRGGILGGKRKTRKKKKRHRKQRGGRTVCENDRDCLNARLADLSRENGATRITGKCVQGNCELGQIITSVTIDDLAPPPLTRQPRLSHVSSLTGGRRRKTRKKNKNKKKRRKKRKKTRRKRR